MSIKEWIAEKLCPKAFADQRGLDAASPSTQVVPGEALLNIAKLAGQYDIRYPTNAAMQAFLDRILSDYEREWKDKLDHADRLQRLFDKQWERTREAGELWRQAHPGNDDTSPDLGELVSWLMSRPQTAMAEYATRLFDLHGFMLFETYRDKPAVTVTFPDLKQAQQFHNTLVELSTHKPRPAPATEGSGE